MQNIEQLAEKTYYAQIGDLIQFPTASDRQLIAQKLFPLRNKVRFQPIAYLLAVLRNEKPDWLLLCIKIEDAKKEFHFRWAYRIDFDLLGTIGSLSDFVVEFEGRTIEITRAVDGLSTKSYRAIGGNSEELQRIKESL